MSSNTTNTPVFHGIDATSLRAWFARSFEAYARRRSRLDRIEALQAMSDVQLAAIGIRREQIVHYVFRDLCWA
ncbi:hypothetical protein ACFQ3C_05415 [Seohaeicola saemankumensis]|uniref:DUF1127 domain-containing protein n=1 Tax=Seohaeicola saemankumensis TaxID=481181 RepID=A0ABW3TA93_9RHOB